MAGVRKIRAVLFDAVGTLIRPVPSVADAYLAVARQFGSRRTREEIAVRFPMAFAQADGAREPGLSRPATNQQAERERWQTIVAAVLDDLPDARGAPFEMLWEHFSQARHWRLFDDVAAAWHATQNSGLLVGIASNFDDRLAAVCRGLPPLDRCEHLFWSARVGWPKPAPEFFAAIEREIGFSSDEILLIGDDYTNDYLGATDAGWHAALICRDEDNALPGDVPAPHLFRDLSGFVSEWVLGGV